MKKILIVSTVSRQFYLFEQSNIEVLKSLGYEVHAAANFSDINKRLDNLKIIRHHFNIERSPFSIKNFKAFKELKVIMKSEKFDAIHCHSPMGGVLARLAAKYVGIPTIIYSAHGFHFYSGAPIVNWMFYYPIERFLSKFTDILITINKEDKERAQNFKMKELVYVPGIGIDTKKFKNVTFKKTEKREELGISNETTVLLSIGEMIKRKNHETALRALANLKNKNFVYLICGTGELEEYLKDLSISLGIEEKVRFLGYRNDISEICLASDIFLFPSYQEGLPVSVMEAMSAGLPVICSCIRGNIDLIDSTKGGYLIEPKDIQNFYEAILNLHSNSELRRKMGNYNLEKIKHFDHEKVKGIMKEVYMTLEEK